MVMQVDANVDGIGIWGWGEPMFTCFWYHKSEPESLMNSIFCYLLIRSAIVIVHQHEHQHNLILVSGTKS